MITSIVIAACFVLGVILGRTDNVPGLLAHPDLSVGTLFVLMFVVGILVGLDRRIPKTFQSVGWRVLTIPAAAVVGTTLGVLLLSPLLALPHHHRLAVGYGLGYYSLSSIMIDQLVGERLALVALLSNVARELLTVVGAPILVRLFGPFAPILAGGATTMDTTLPSIIYASGREYIPVAVFNSAALTLLVPVLVTLVL